MTARLHEELLAGRPVHEAVVEAVRHVAPAIGAAGLVLASSFATLMLASGQAFKQSMLGGRRVMAFDWAGARPGRVDSLSAG